MLNRAKLATDVSGYKIFMVDGNGAVRIFPNVNVSSYLNVCER